MIRSTPEQRALLHEALSHAITVLTRTMQDFDYLPDAALSEDIYDVSWSLKCSAEEFDQARMGE